MALFHSFICLKTHILTLWGMGRRHVADRQTLKIITRAWIIVKTTTITDYAADKSGNFSVTIVMQQTDSRQTDRQ